jgi:hypothetical protein
LVAFDLEEDTGFERITNNRYLLRNWRAYVDTIFFARVKEIR